MVSRKRQRRWADTTCQHRLPIGPPSLALFGVALFSRIAENALETRVLGATGRRYSGDLCSDDAPLAQVCRIPPTGGRPAKTEPPVRAEHAHAKAWAWHPARNGSSTE